MTVDVTAMMRHGDMIRGTGERTPLRSRFGLSESQTVFVYVGRLESYKGITVLLEAFAALARLRPECALLIVGDGALRGQVEAAAAGSPTIAYAGRRGTDDVMAAYACADVAVLPSTFEPWGLVVNEAMAFGLPVIATDRVGCVDDLVLDGKTGRVVKAESAAALQAAMQELAASEPDRRRLGEAARALISGWTLENQAAILVSAWREWRRK